MLYFTLIYLIILYLLRNLISKKTTLFLSLLPLLIIIWTRYGIGTDFFSYEDMYYRIDISSFKNLFIYYDEIEIGYKLVMFPFRFFGMSFYFFSNIVTSVILLFGVKWLDDNSNELSLSVLLLYSMFFLVWNLSAMRQSIPLFIGLYLLFNEKKHFTLVQSLVISLVLSLFHYSAVFLFVVDCLRRVRWNQKNQIVFLVFSLLVTLLPLSTIVSYFDFIPGISHVVDNYMSVSYVFYDFPGLIRILIFIFVILFYNKLEDRKYYVDPLLYGFSIYFLLKFSELTAARITIYTYVLIIIVLPDIVNILRNLRYKYMSVMVSIAVIFGSGLYFTKEFRTMLSQSEFSNDISLLTFPNIVTNDYFDFSSRSVFETTIKNETHKYKQEYEQLSIPREIVEFDIDDSYTTIKVQGGYVIINQDGNYLGQEKYTYKSEVIGTVLVYESYEKNKFFSVTKYKDLTGNDTPEDELIEIVSKEMTKNEYITVKETDLSNEYNEVPNNLSKFYSKGEEVSKIITHKIDNGFEYYMMIVDYYGRRTYIYFDSNFEPMFKFPLKEARLYNEEGFMTLNIYGDLVIVNKNGKIVWWD